ncbi:Hpt domain-containing protein [Desulfonatronum thioautotrophicum]|uniref:Hpt domain-containing protein n=1 Tax=Desulfonatronum thioautotrophicum TaxID=617001 RepID=UPI0005EBA6B7|nr:Hpt domain-containing protein [Desulfonatronum thioautotrophicum]
MSSAGGKRPRPFRPSPAKMATLARNLAEHNLQALQTEAHALKGLALSTSCTALADAARRLEAAAQNADRTTIPHLHSELLHESERLRRTIQEQAS